MSEPVRAGSADLGFGVCRSRPADPKAKIPRLWVLTGRPKPRSAHPAHTGSEIRIGRYIIHVWLFGAENPILGEEYDVIGAENPILGEEHYIFGAKNPILGEEYSAFGAKSLI